MWQRRRKSELKNSGQWTMHNNNLFPIVNYHCSILILIILLSCNSPYIPKPAGYFKINFPEKKYQQFNKQDYPYTFEYPVYANVVKDSTFFGDSTENPWWVNIDFPQFSARIYLSYKIIGGEYKLDKLLNDAFNLTNKHTVKATGIDEGLIAEKEHNVYGVYYTIDGNTASSTQFFLTDSNKNYLRAALYFNEKPQPDSIQPVVNFIKTDIDRMIKTFRWKKP